jgi:hypothetical protein
LRASANECFFVYQINIHKFQDELSDNETKYPTFFGQK